MATQTNSPALSTEQNRTLLAVFSYLGPLVIVSLLIGKTDSFVKFHVKQGLVLFSIEVIIWLISSLFWAFWMILNLVNLGVLVLSIIGIMNVLQKQEKALPLVGSLASYFKI